MSDSKRQKGRATPPGIKASGPDRDPLSHIPESLQSLAVGIDTLIPDEHNTRIHPEGNIAAIEASFREFGQDQVLVYNSRTHHVVKGNARLAVAKSLGWRFVAAIPVDESVEESAARSLVDNRTNELGQWDAAILGQILGRVQRLPGLSEQVARALAELANDQGISEAVGSPNDEAEQNRKNAGGNAIPAERQTTYATSSERKIVLVLPSEDRDSIGKTIDSIIERELLKTPGDVLCWIADRYAKRHRLGI